MSGDRGAPEPDEIDRRLAAWDERSRRLAEQEHMGQCVLLDDPCCGRLWGNLRREDPHVIELVESLYGKDWWRSVPLAMRMAFAIIASRNENLQHVGSRIEELEARFASEVDDAVMQRLRAQRGRS